MKTKTILAKTKSNDTDWMKKLDGANLSAKRKAFKKNLPIAIFENGKVYFVYRNNVKVEATPELIAQLQAK